MELPDSRHVHSVDDVREGVLDGRIVQTLDYPLNKLCIQLTICVYWINSIDKKMSIGQNTLHPGQFYSVRLNCYPTTKYDHSVAIWCSASGNFKRNHTQIFISFYISSNFNGFFFSQNDHYYGFLTRRHFIVILIRKGFQIRRFRIFGRYICIWIFFLN